MAKTRRDRAIATLKALWDKRDIPHIPHNELRRASDETVLFLLRFWTFKDRNWDAVTPVEFSEEPPHGWAAFFRERATASGHPRNESPAFKTPGGGYLTPRQAQSVK